MDSSTAAPTCGHARIHLTTTRPTEFLDLTDRLDRLVAAWAIRSGMLNVQSLHTTAGIVVNEHEPLLLRDFQALFERTVPQHDRYGHDDEAVRSVNVQPGERQNGHAHCRAVLLPTSVCLNVADGRLLLGAWQRVFFVELDGPQSRDVSVVALGEAAR